MAGPGFAFVELLVLIVVVGLTASLLVPAIWRARRNARVTRCVNNLVQLSRIQTTYAQQFGDCPDHLWPRETGGGYWLSFTRTSPPLLDDEMAWGRYAILDCPLESGAPAKGRTSYRGPAMDINNRVERYLPADPVGADLDGAHGHGEGGCVLRRSGDVSIVTPRDQVWKVAAERTKP
jgi:type II secretory pathway pseudopilin PulG